MRKLKLSDVTWTLTAEPEDVRVRGNALASGDDAADKAAEDAIIADLDGGNEWAWCTAYLVGRYKGLKAHATLGCCSYKDAEDFKRGGYYADMRREVLESLQAQAKDLYTSLAD